MIKSKVFIALFATSLFLVGCSDSEEAVTEEKTTETETAEVDAPEEAEVPEEEETPAEAGYTADDAYQWLNESGLVGDTPIDETDKYEGSEGLVKYLRTEEANISEFETEEQAAKYHDPGMNSHSVKNINVLIKKGEDNAENFITVLENGGPSDDLETAYASDAQQAYVETIQGGADFVPYVDGYYNLPSEERSSTYDSFIVDKEVTWTGTIADLDAMGDSIVVYGKENYNGEDWATISSEKKDMMPYTFVAELKDEATKEALKNGDSVTIKGVVGSRGDKEMQYNWKLYESEIVQ